VPMKQRRADWSACARPHSRRAMPMLWPSRSPPGAAPTRPGANASARRRTSPSGETEKTTTVGLSRVPRRASAGSLQPVGGAQHTLPAAVENMRVDHRGAHVGMAEQFLHRPDVGTALQHRPGKRG